LFGSVMNLVKAMPRAIKAQIKNGAIPFRASHRYAPLAAA
jgi:hypothetical protein